MLYCVLPPLLTLAMQYTAITRHMLGSAADAASCTHVVAAPSKRSSSSQSRTSKEGTHLKGESSNHGKVGVFLTGVEGLDVEVIASYSVWMCVCAFCAGCMK